jgi:hypothetical protein
MDYIKIAIIYTGQVRIIGLTIKYFKQNVLLINENVHVCFITIRLYFDHFKKFVKDQMSVWTNSTKIGISSQIYQIKYYARL